MSLLVDIVLFLSYQISDCSSKKKTVCSWLILRIEKGKSAEVYFGNNVFFFDIIILPSRYIFGSEDLIK